MLAPKEQYLFSKTVKREITLWAPMSSPITWSKKLDLMALSLGSRWGWSLTALNRKL